VLKKAMESVDGKLREVEYLHMINMDEAGQDKLKKATHNENPQSNIDEWVVIEWAPEGPA
jgi:hypothetical protein